MMKRSGHDARTLERRFEDRLPERSPPRPEAVRRS
jgi:hypothetical protein